MNFTSVPLSADITKTSFVSRTNLPDNKFAVSLAGIGKSFMIWSDSEYEKEYQNTQKILQSSGPPKLILNKKAGVSNE